MRSPRSLLLLLGCAAPALAAVQGPIGMQELAFYAGPFLLLGRRTGGDAPQHRKEVVEAW